MKRIQIQEICEVYDGPHATPTKTNVGPVYLGIDAITDDGRLDSASFAHLSDEDYEIWARRVTPKEDDIVFSYEATLGRYALIPKGFHGCLGRRLAIVRNKSDLIDTHWLYYYFRSPEWTAFINRNIIKGSTVNRISVEDFPTYSVPLIDISTQKKAVALLSAIDKKIDGNLVINDNLQEQMRLLYDFWFTQFDFPNANGKPYRTSGGKMKWSEALKCQIPFNWHEAHLKDVLYVSGQATESGKFSSSLYYTPIDVLPKRTLTFAGGLPSSEANSSLQLYRENDILLGAMRVYFHRICIAAQSGVTRTTTLILTPLIPDHLGYAYQILNGDNAILYATQHSNGTQQPYINWNGALENYCFAMPNDNQLIEEYSHLIKPMIDEAKMRARESTELIKLRDWLLPMLMNGQATIGD